MMKLYFTLMFWVVFLIGGVLAEESVSKTAKVDYSKIEDLLIRVVLSQPEHKELAESYTSWKSKLEASQKKMQESLMKGEKINPMEAASSYIDDAEKRKEVERLSEKYLLSVIEKNFMDKYDLVLKFDYKSPVLYSRDALDDVTDLIRQELLRQLSAENQ